MFEHTDPFELYREWAAEAASAVEVNPDAASLATVDLKGQPRVRSVLIKELTDRGFVFYTNYRSRKGRQLDKNPAAALCIYWRPLARQILAQGPVGKISAEDSDAYFATRFRASQLGAWASDQSQPVESRDALNQQFVDTVIRFPDGPVPRPPHWGGYCLVPNRVEFWREQANRFHDRIEFWRDGPDAPWQKQILQP